MLYIYIRVCVYVCIYIHVCVYMCIYIYMCVYICVYIHTHTHTHIFFFFFFAAPVAWKSSQTRGQTHTIPVTRVSSNDTESLTH